MTRYIFGTFRFAHNSNQSSRNSFELSSEICLANFAYFAQQQIESLRNLRILAIMASAAKPVETKKPKGDKKPTTFSLIKDAILTLKVILSHWMLSVDFPGSSVWIWRHVVKFSNFVVKFSNFVVDIQILFAPGKSGYAWWIIVVDVVVQIWANLTQFKICWWISNFADVLWNWETVCKSLLLLCYL